MNYAIVENGIVVNIIVADAAFAETIGALPAYDGCAIGEVYDPQYEPTEEDDINQMLVDHELRISMLEIGGEI